MKTRIYLLLVIMALLYDCHPSVEASTAYNIAGSYQLIEYMTSTLSDDNPSGTIEAVEADEQHVNLLVKGSSGKVKISYSYLNVLVTSSGSSQGEDSYTLFYKGRQIGMGGNDAISRFLTLAPSSTVKLKAVEF